MRTSGVAGNGSWFDPGSQTEVRTGDDKRSHGKILVVGLGPGKRDLMTPRAIEALQKADVIIGYKTYIDLITDLITDQKVISSGMRREIERARIAVAEACCGQTVAVVSSGDAGVYGMAGIVLEIAADSVSVEVIPGITAATSIAARLGAPLMHDFAVISLSDLLTPLNKIMTRLQAAGLGDYVVILYNPASNGRKEHIKMAREILLWHKDPLTPVGIVRNAEREGEEVVITTLKDMLSVEMDMFTTVIIGNSETRAENGYMITPRGYKL